MRTRLVAVIVTVGMVVGGSLVALSRDADIQTPGAKRLSVIRVGDGIAFIRDGKSGGCWIAHLQDAADYTLQSISTIAVAPEAACR